MFKKIFVSSALLALASTNAFASDVSDYGHQLLAAKATIEGVLDGNISVPVPGQGGSHEEPGIDGETSSGTGEDWFQDDAKAQPEYRASALKFGDAGNKFLQSDSLRLQGKFAESVIRRTEACADLNIALVNLSVANHYAIQPGFSTILKPFNDQFKDLYSNISGRRPLICK